MNSVIKQEKNKNKNNVETAQALLASLPLKQNLTKNGNELE